MKKKSLILSCGFALLSSFMSFGQITGKLYFDGVDDYVTVPTNAGLNASRNTEPCTTADNRFSVEVWVRGCAKDNGMDSYILNKGTQVMGWNLGIFKNGSPFMMNAGKFIMPSQCAPQQFPKLLDDQWHHIAVTRNGGTTKFYVDGAYLCETYAIYNDVDINSNANLLIGKNVFVGPGINSFKGYISEVRYWNTNISDAQIAQNFNRRINPNSANLTAYHPLSEGSGQTIGNLAAGYTTITGVLGTNNTSETFDPSWKMAQQLTFDGSNDYVQINRYPALDLGLGSFTFEARIRANAAQQNYAQIMSYRSTVNDGFLFGLWPDGRPFVQIGGSTGNWVAPNAPDLRDNNWHHVAVTRNAATGALNYYVDGTLTGTLFVTVAGRNIVSAGPLRIGQDAASPGNTAFAGIIADARIWNIERTQTQIAANTTASLQGTEAGLVGAWELNQVNPGQVTPNTVTTGNNGILGSTAAADINDPIVTTQTCFTSTLKTDNSADFDFTETNNSDKINVYPNPFNESATFSYTSDSEEPVNVTVTDMTGRVILNMNQLSPNTDYEISNEISGKGIYLMSVKQGNRSENYRIQKQ
jgi:hypothetical protein